MLAALAAIVTVAAPGPEAAVRQDPARSPRNASYTLKARLDAANHVIDGSGKLRWRNISRNPATELRFHLYWNAWRDRKSTWLRELERARGDTGRAPADFGSIAVSTLAVRGANLLDRARFVAEDDGNQDDRTVLAVPLDQPVAPGETIDIDFAWKATVPRTFARTGRLGDYYFIAQWFPKIGVLEDAGWNAHQFHLTTEFCADFGVYDVTLDVPQGWAVGATGIEQSRADEGGRTSIRFVQDDVHDFAWTTSPSFVERRERFEDPALPSVELRLLLQPEHDTQADRHFNAARAALKYYGTWFGAYPYRQLTIVDPVTTFNPDAQGDDTGGMEYPTLITAGTHWYNAWSDSNLEEVTIHEAGHQFWYGVVATNEFEHAWMDEGLNTFSTARAMREAYPGRFTTVGRYFGGLASWAYTDVPWSLEVDGYRVLSYRRAAALETQARPSWQYAVDASGGTTYSKTAVWLGTLERLLGWEVTEKILATHFQRGAFRHPAPDDFFAIASEVSGRDLSWFFDAVYRGSATFDYAAAPPVSAEHDGTFHHSVTVRRVGDGVFPIRVRVTTGGTVRLFDWDGRARWTTFEFTDAERMSRVEVDPDRVLLLDTNFTNNSWSSAPRGAEAARKWAWRWLTWAQELLLTYAFVS